MGRVKSTLKSAPAQVAQLADRISALADEIDNQQYTLDELYHAFIAPLQELQGLLERPLAKLSVRLMYAEADAAERRSQFKVIGNNQVNQDPGPRAKLADR